MVFNATFNDISLRSVLLEETEYPGKTTDLPQVIVSSTPRMSGIRAHNGSGDRH
jgi:hypothetical protein